MGTQKRNILLFGLFLTFSARSAASAAGQSNVNVAPPNGKDDTANLQTALDECAAQVPGCTVRLQAGKYFTKQLVTYNFRGTLKGMGIGSTTIEALHPLPVNIPDVSQGECIPNITTCLWPALIMFVEGNIHVSDLSIRITAPPGTATTGWSFAGTEFTDLIDAVRFMGQYPMKAAVDRISIEGLPDNSPTSFGFNLINGVIFVGELPRSSQPFDYYVLSGSLTVRNSSFKTMDDGIAGGQLTSSHFMIGGSPSTGNVFGNVYAGMDLESAEKSDFEISYNTSSGISAAMWVIPYHLGLPHALLPSQPSQYSIHDNNFVGVGYSCGVPPCGDGMYFIDGPSKPWIQAAVWNNTIQLQNALMEGIGAYNTIGTAIWNNSITGSDGYDGIGLWNSSYDTVIHNNVSGFTVDSSVGNAQIYLDPSTNRDLVVCAEPSDSVLNQGTNNVVIGCQQSVDTTRSFAPATVVPRHDLSRGKPWLH